MNKVSSPEERKTYKQFNSYTIVARTVASTYRRSRIELYVDILQAIANGRESPAKIVYAANLSYDRVVKCLEFLEEQSLVQRTENANKKRRYKVTPKGMEVVRYFTEVQSALFYKKKAFSNISVHFTRR